MIDLAAVLRASGLDVVEVPGWRDRGHPGTFRPDYVVWHHDASPKGPSPGALEWVKSGPWANLWIDMAGTVYVVAAGLCWHAGQGGPYHDVPAGMMNGRSWGIETDHTDGEPWPAAQLRALEVTTAALLNAKARPTDPYMLFHLTWAPARKHDPAGLSLAGERHTVDLDRHPLDPATPVPPTPTKRRKRAMGYILDIRPPDTSMAAGLYLAVADADGWALSGLSASDAAALQADGVVRLTPYASTEFRKAHVKA